MCLDQALSSIATRERIHGYISSEDFVTFILPDGHFHYCRVEKEKEKKSLVALFFLFNFLGIGGVPVRTHCLILEG